MKVALFAVVHFAYILIAEAARILAIFPTPSISHQVVFRPLTLELVARGHEVVVVTTDPAYPKGGGPKNLTEIDTSGIYQEFASKTNKYLMINEYADIRSSMENGVMIGNELFYHQLKTEILGKFIHDRSIKFDLLIIEAWLRPLLAFTHRFKVPVIRFGSVGSFLSEYQVMRGFGHPLYHPTSLCSRCANVENLTFLEKVYEICNYIYINSIHNSYENDETNYLRTIFGSEMPSVDELSDNVDLYISNVYRVWELNSPMPLSVVQVGGIHLNSECSYSKDLEDYLDSSVNGVLYISFGTNMRTSWLDTDNLQAMVEVLSQMDYDVLWKYDEDELPGKSDNIKIMKWLPQECLLKHPKIKLFITQGGLQSTEEAIAAGVPLVGIPIIVDQFGNTQNYVRHKIGVRLLFKDLTKESFRHAIYTVLNDESYRLHVERLRTLIELDGDRSAARAARWVEHVARHGGSHLRAPAARLHAAVYHHLQLLAELAAAALFTCFIAYTVLKILFRLILKTVKRRIRNFK
ncbi:UDP-glucosyltransferase 2-like [Achroia grisella]|uniref:UDP-glucosyltransferase 2-like n=1 Tax=Achroia grisella TaxID=688607 RepID=UPI0027D268D1|nr:UDP-glucosyltransferase 2-like [Achroia grisella]